MTDHADLIARLFAGNAGIEEAADAIEALVRERDEAETERKVIEAKAAIMATSLLKITAERDEARALLRRLRDLYSANPYPSAADRELLASIDAMLPKEPTT